MLVIEPQSKILKKGETYQLEVTKDFEGTVKYTSSNKNVVTVDESGLVTAVGVTSAYITAFAKGPKGLESDAIRIDVPGLMMTPPNPNNETFEIKQGENIVFSILKKHPANYEVEASVDDTTIARIKNVGATSFVLNALEEGQVIITFNLVDTSVEDETQKIIDTVKYQVLVGNVESLSFTKKEFECELTDKEVELPIAISPEGEECHVKSLNKDVFTINEEGKGVPTGLGTAVLNVRRFDLSDSAIVRVKGLQVKPIGTLSTNHRIKLDVQCTEKGSPAFETSDEKIATISKKGIVTGVSVGNVEITVTVGKYSTSIELKCVEYFTPIEDLTTEIKKTIKIFCNLAELKAYAKGRPIITQSILDGLIPIHYIKSNEDPNLFEYELAILDKDLTRYNSLQTEEEETTDTDTGAEPEP